MRKIKLIWDFRGPDASKTAQHHEIHLKEYLQLQNSTSCITGFEDVNPLYSLAFLVVDEQDMIPVRDALKPHRGDYYLD